MKFNFEKHVPEKERPEPVELEKTQEEFDAEILKEADKLGVSLEQLKADIDSFGGPEKFKELWEQSSGHNNMSKATKEIHELNRDEKEANRNAKIYAIAGSIMTAITALMVSGINQGGNIELENLKRPLEILQQEWNDGFMGKVGVGVVTFFASVGVGGFIGAIKQGIEARRTKRKKQAEELKFKMTGTEVK